MSFIRNFSSEKLCFHLSCVHIITTILVNFSFMTKFFIEKQNFSSKPLISSLLIFSKGKWLIFDDLLFKNAYLKIF